jgi:fucose 4-O-acetylase-like acetyltransferase
MILAPADRNVRKLASGSFLTFDMRGGPMAESSKRQVWVDVARTLALILVVVGHPVGPAVYTKYIYWFHMPVFFLLSGYLFKPPDGWSSLGSWLSKRSRELLVPYCAYLVLLTLVRYFYVYRYLHVLEASFVWKDLLEVLFGGRAPGVYYTVFWFFTCLFATQVLFALINLLCKDSRLVLAAVAIAYLLAHAESWLMINHPPLVPWDLDVALIAVVYYAIGYFCKKLLADISLRITLVTVAVSGLLIAIDYRGWMNYVLNLKYVVYQHLLLDLLIPMVMAVALLGISQILARGRLGRAVTLMGNVALPVVYLHVPINTVLLIEYHCHYGNVAAVLFGFVTPIILSKLVFERFSWTRYLFQGRVPGNRKPGTGGQRPEILPG